MLRAGPLANKAMTVLEECASCTGRDMSNFINAVAQVKQYLNGYWTIICSRSSYAIKPPVIDPPRYGWPLYNRWTTCPRLTSSYIIFQPPRSGQPLNSGQRTYLGIDGYGLLVNLQDEDDLPTKKQDLCLQCVCYSKVPLYNMPPEAQCTLR